MSASVKKGCQMSIDQAHIYRKWPNSTSPYYFFEAWFPQVLFEQDALFGQDALFIQSKNPSVEKRENIWSGYEKPGQSGNERERPVIYRAFWGLSPPPKLLKICIFTGITIHIFFLFVSLILPSRPAKARTTHFCLKSAARPGLQSGPARGHLKRLIKKSAKEEWN